MWKQREKTVTFRPSRETWNRSFSPSTKEGINAATP